MRRLLCSLLTLASSWCVQADEPGRVAPSRLAWWPNPELLRTLRTSSNVTVQTPPFDPGFTWKEAVVSWNTAHAEGLSVRVRPIWKGDPGPWYVMAHWCQDTNTSPRTSVPNQSDSAARVDTDTLLVANPATAIEVELTLSTATTKVPADLRIGVSLLGSETTALEPLVHRPAWGRLLTVPIRSQADYPEGVQSWCSPSSLSMILSHWGNQLAYPELLQDVPQVARGVFDPAWPGTGNWTFNAAYAGQYRTLSACVSRLGGMGDLERWIAAEMPVATSVSYAQLKGSAKPKPGDGHLVVVTGFTSAGDVQVHDPGVRRERVVRTIPRADFMRAWNHSSRTAYLIWSRNSQPPTGGDGRWPTR